MAACARYLRRVEPVEREQHTALVSASLHLKPQVDPGAGSRRLRHHLFASGAAPRWRRRSQQGRRPRAG